MQQDRRRGEAAGAGGAEGGEGQAKEKEGEGEKQGQRGSQLRCCKVEQKSHHSIPAKNTFLKTSQLFRGSRGALESYITGELKGVSNEQKASGNKSPRT